MRVEIPMRAWARGQGLGKGRLMSAPGPMKCALGFILTAYGVPDEYLLLDIMPDYAVRMLPPAFFEIRLSSNGQERVANSALSYAIATLNDDEALTDVERMDALTFRLLEAGIDLRFVDAPYDREHGCVEPNPVIGQAERVAVCNAALQLDRVLARQASC